MRICLCILYIFVSRWGKTVSAFFDEKRHSCFSAVFIHFYCMNRQYCSFTLLVYISRDKEQKPGLEL